ncbi:hypothetical protein BX666DRAFT_605512 [Dichotomocladium elegans]|nr:hypothetical protein BX666DRAFT_605512 [Dichotomocladium elegans]
MATTSPRFCFLTKTMLLLYLPLLSTHVCTLVFCKLGIGLITITFTASTAIAFRFVDLEAVFGERQIIHPIQHSSFEIDLFTAFIIVVHVIAIVIVIVLTHRTGLVLLIPSPRRSSDAIDLVKRRVTTGEHLCASCKRVCEGITGR